MPRDLPTFLRCVVAAVLLVSISVTLFTSVSTLRFPAARSTAVLP